MRFVLGWLIEQACRVTDGQVCAFANLTDDDGGSAATG